eukprot:8985108-Ditylum_brightwellii.AAC.1
MRQQCRTIHQQCVMCRNIVILNDSSFGVFVLTDYDREDYSSDSSEEDYSISKDEHVYPAIDTTTISMSSIDKFSLSDIYDGS